MTSLSVIIITCNEAPNIRKTLDSVGFADEIIVLDSGSTDNTTAICREYTDRVFDTDWPGFGPQKNRALGYVKGDWVLSIDADEVITPKLSQEIMHTIQCSNTDINAYAVTRRSRYLGKLIRYGDWRNDRPIRLFRRDKARFSDDAVHERLVVEGETGHCREYMLHDAFTSLDEVIDKMNLYSTLSAEMKRARGQSGGLFKAITHGVWTFIRGYLLRFGFLDGKEGFMLAVSNAQGCYYRYLKMGIL